MMVFTCEPDFEAMLTCIYDAWEWAIKNGHDNVQLKLEPVLQNSLFETYQHVDRDSEKAEKVARSIRRKVSVQAYHSVYYACLYFDDVLDVIYRYLRIGFKVGKRVDQMLTEPSVMRIMEVRRKVGNEIHYFREFLRFHSLSDKIYVSHFEPKCNVAYQVAVHFADRMPSEHFMIIDDNRRFAVVHPKDGEMYIQTLTKEQLGKLMKSEEYQDEFTELWKLFFHTISIKERENYQCQRNMMPLWMRKHVTEFQGDK